MKLRNLKFSILAISLLLIGFVFGSRMAFSKAHPDEAAALKPQVEQREKERREEVDALKKQINELQGRVGKLETRMDNILKPKIHPLNQK